MLHLTENNPRALLRLTAKQLDKLYEAYQIINDMLKDDIDKLAKVLNDYI